MAAWCGAAVQAACHPAVGQRFSESALCCLWYEYAPPSIPRTSVAPLRTHFLQSFILELNTKLGSVQCASALAAVARSPVAAGADERQLQAAAHQAAHVICRSTEERALAHLGVRTLDAVLQLLFERCVLPNVEAVEAALVTQSGLERIDSTFSVAQHPVASLWLAQQSLSLTYAHGAPSGGH